jgi:hypothetical protein
MLLTLSGWYCFQLLRDQTNSALVSRGNLLAGEDVIGELKKPVTLIRMSPDALPGWEGCHPLRRINSNPNLRIVPTGWQIGSPRYNSILADLGFESGSEMLSHWSSDPNVGQYFVRRINDRSTRVPSLSPAWKSYFQRWHPQRSLADQHTTWIKMKNSDQLAIFQLHE